MQGTCFLLFLASILFSLTSATTLHTIEGEWRDDKNGAVILIYEENGLYFGQLIQADEPEENQRIQEYDKIVLMKNFEKTSSNEFCCGTIYQPREKRTISATLILEDHNTIKINGRYGIFTGTHYWKRY